MKPTSQEARQIAVETIQWAKKVVKERHYLYVADIAAYLTRFDAPKEEPQPFMLKDVLEYLVRAAEILLYKKDYDGPDYEEMNHCVKRAKEIMQGFDAPTVADKESEVIVGVQCPSCSLNFAHHVNLDFLNTPAPQNAAGDNWIREEAVLNFARYIENRVQHFHNWQIYEIKTLTEAYLKLPSPPTATAEQDKKDNNENN